MATSDEYSKAQSERMRAAWRRRRENGTDKREPRHPDWKPGHCRKCAGPKGTDIIARRSWYCAPCDEQRRADRGKARSKCGSCLGEWDCLACKRIAKERMIAAARGRKTRIGAPYRKPDHAEKYWQSRCHTAVQWAIQSGFLPSLRTGQYACADCGGVAREYDHRDYGRPLEVAPVCRSCNKRRGTAKWPKPQAFPELIFGPAPEQRAA